MPHATRETGGKIGPATRLRQFCIAGSAALAMQGFAAVGAAHEGYADLVEELKPSVVSIYVAKDVPVNMPMEEFQFPENSPFNELFREFFNWQQRSEPQRRRSMALGSGFITDESGYIVTNHHVIEGAAKINVRLHDEREFTAELVGADPKTDIALLRISAGEPLPAVSFGDSEKVRVGDPVLVIGNPHGFGFSVSAGIISARNRSLNGTYDDFLQTDAAINVGNSGGPLFNQDGEVIGVNTAIIGRAGSATPSSLGIGFSMSSAVVTKVVAQLEEFGTTRRGWVGLMLQHVTPDIAEAVGLDRTTGAIVADVPDGPAKDAGLKPGDIILSFNGIETEDVRDLVRVIGDAEVGMLAPIVVLRDGEQLTFDVRIARREEAEQMIVQAAATSDEPTMEREVLGISLSPLTAEARQEVGLDEGANGVLVREVNEDSVAFEKGIREGDLIVEVDYRPVTSVGGVLSGIEDVKDAGRKTVLMLIERGEERRFVALPVDSG